MPLEQLKETMARQSLPASVFSAAAAHGEGGGQEAPAAPGEISPRRRGGRDFLRPAGPLSRVESHPRKSPGKRLAALLLALLLVLPATGCVSLLERSYSTLEPYTDRYRDFNDDTNSLRADNYQDLVNSLLMLVEQRAESGSIRYYGVDHPFVKAQSARREVLEKTPLGAYLLESMAVTFRTEADCQLLNYTMTYRPGTVDPQDILDISNIQSLLDMLRLSVREHHRVVTARFTYGVDREEIRREVEALWEESFYPLRGPDRSPISPERMPDVMTYVPIRPISCPWTVHFYPDWDGVTIVEVRLR